MYDFSKIFGDFRRGSIERFYRDLYPGMIVYAARQLGPELAYLAEDCVQDAILTSYNKRDDFENGPAWHTYLLRAVFNNAVNMVRHHSAFGNYKDNQMNAGEDLHLDRSFETSMIEQEALEQLHAAVEALPEKMRQILVLSFRDGLKNAEIAERLGMAEITVKKQKAKMFVLLRDSLGKMGYDSDTLLILLLTEYFCVNA